MCTPAAEVRVHGTRFQVVRDGSGTLVSVTEGLVEVVPYGGGRSSLLLRPGESTKVASAADFRSDLRGAALGALGRGEFAVARRHLESLLQADLAPLELAEAHALLAWALAGSGERGPAVDRYRLALGMLPEGQSPLWADNASAELALLLEQGDPAAAVPAWREYLARFPEGIHAALARARLAAEKER